MKINSWDEFNKVRLDIKITEIELEGITYKRHINPDNSIGGFVAITAKVEKTVFIEFSARVYGNAWVSGNARVYGDAWVYGNARVYGDKITTILKTIQVFSYCVSITDNYVFCGCYKFTHQEVKVMKYQDSKARDYMTEKQFKILKKAILEIIKY